MTLAEVDEHLPNGFHDAEIKQFTFDLPTEILLIKVDIWVGSMNDSPDLRERYRRGELRFLGVDFFSLPTPYAKPSEWIIHSFEQETYALFDTRYPAQNEREQRLLAFKVLFGYSELFIAAESFTFEWLTEEETNRNP